MIKGQSGKGEGGGDQREANADGCDGGSLVGTYPHHKRT